MRLRPLVVLLSLILKNNTKPLTATLLPQSVVLVLYDYVIVIGHVEEVLVILRCLQLVQLVSRRLVLGDHLSTTRYRVNNQRWQTLARYDTPVNNEIQGKQSEMADPRSL